MNDWDVEDSDRLREEAANFQARLVEVAKSRLDSGDRLSEVRESLMKALCAESPPAKAFRAVNDVARASAEEAETVLKPVIEALQEFEISAPVSLTTETLPTIEPNLFPEWVENQITGVAAATETPVELPAGIALGALAGSIQGKLRVEVKPGYSEPLNLWTIVALGSGERKTAVVSAMTRPLMEWESSKLDRARGEIARAESERATTEARIQALRSAAVKAKNPSEFEARQKEIAELEANLPDIPKSPRAWCQDVTPERLRQLMADHGERMSILSDEAGIFDILAGRYSNGIPNLDLFLQGHAGAPVRVDRGSRAAVMMQNPALTMALSPQPEALRGLSSNRAFRGRGLLARILYLIPASKVGQRTGAAAPLSDSTSYQYALQLRRLLDLNPADHNGQPVPHVIHLSREALSEWRSFFAVVEADAKVAASSISGTGRENCREPPPESPGFFIARFTHHLPCAHAKKNSMATR